jgi:hypothetical protein
MSESENNQVIWVTSAFLGAREDRSWLYYLHPLAEQAEAVTASGALFYAWTWDRSVRAVRAVVDGQYVRLADPVELARRHWDRDSWEGRLGAMHVRPESIEVRNPLLFHVWLAKLPLVLKSLEETGAEVGLWVDCGHAISYECGHDYDAYTSQLTARWDLARALPAITGVVRKQGILLCGELPQERPLDLERTVYDRYCAGAIFAVRADYGAGALAGVQGWWRKMLRAGRISTDEPAFALAAAEQGWPMWSYARWQEVLCGGTP